uniref:Uncharacterized protein n=1 Tax=Oryza brachyantha TaxID=4533 RepID=J3LKR1_ORYBR
MEITSTAMLRPVYGKPHPLAGAAVQLTVFDRAAFDLYVPSVLAYPAPAPSNEADNVGAALLQIKLIRYRCGGLVVGSICPHHTADGHPMSAFFTAWASAVREGEGFTVPTPFLDRAATAVPRSPPAPAFDHRSIEFFEGGEAAAAGGGRAHAVVPMDKIRDLNVHFTAEFVAELKARAGGRCSTFQCLLAHVWKKVTAARDLSPEEFTQVRVAVNCRGRANPPGPKLWAFPRLQRLEKRVCVNC